MVSEFIPLTFSKIMQSKSYTVFILGTDQKRFAIYTEPHVGQMIQIHLAEKVKPRPYTHDLINTVFKGFEIKILQIVIADVQDTVYLCRLFIEKTLGDQHHILEIDARPSDCLTLALMNSIPIFCKRDILDKVIAVED